ncbi:MAG: hypothetical protein DI616_15820 [Paracoccus denitrificans]|uniref:Uncharacterized protein n=1 Tax=Paracoccus denitrificans TaxID=266 RepID=A0A533I499_PARDE|nr:MAG: hypothetical protein DI616_15820 [Paracoccus denitrificans]
MSTIYYLIDGYRVRTLQAAHNGANLDVLYRWHSVNPLQRSVWSEKSDLWYRALRNGWSTGVKQAPKAITMSRLVDAISQTNWKEVRDEIPPNTF